MAPQTYTESFDASPGVEAPRSAMFDWEPLDVPNPDHMPPKSALTGSRPSS